MAQTVTQLRDRKYAKLKNETARNRALAEAADTTLSQIQRITKGTMAVGIDTLERVATALEVRPQDLVTPYYVSQPKTSEYLDSNDDDGDGKDELQRRPSR